MPTKRKRKPPPLNLEAVRLGAPEFRAVVGVDASIAKTGFASWEEGVPYSPLVRVIETRERGQAHFNRNERMDESAGVIGSRVPYNSLVLLEGPAYAAKGSSFHDLAGHWWKVYDRLSTGWAKVIVVPPPNLKKFATGKGTASKEDVMLAAVRRWPDLKITDNNTADAAVLMQMGRVLLGADLDMPKTHLEGLDGLADVIPWVVAA